MSPELCPDCNKPLVRTGKNRNSYECPTKGCVFIEVISPHGGRPRYLRAAIARDKIHG